MNNKSQITLFFIIGIIILVASFLVYFVQNTSSKENLRSETSLPILIENDKQQIKSFIELCIANVVEPMIIDVAKRGGSFSKPSILFQDNPLTTLATYVSGFGYTQTYVTKTSIAEELNAKIMQALPSCIGKNVFEEQGFRFNGEVEKVNTIVRIDDVQILVHFPLTLKKGTYTVDLEEFSATVNLPLGRLFASAIDIINEEATNGYFDKEKYMLPRDVRIEKHKPYPNTIYIIKKFSPKLNQDFIFQFSIKGSDTAGKEIITYNAGGCCTNNQDSICYKNVDSDVCDGTYNQDSSCTCKSNSAPLEGCCETQNSCSVTKENECLGRFYKDDFTCSNAACASLHCENTYKYETNDFTGPKRTHGESWCSYESITGRGWDYVGTRHYLHSCINGKEIVEECRDFREEFCIERSENGKTQAKCRLNRWYDCADQVDRASCEDKTVRDCYWTGFIESQKKCHPSIPPGLKFWETTSKSICNVASLDKDQTGAIFQKAWSQSTALYCLRSGDCGNARNAADVPSELGYYNPLAVPKEGVYGNAGYNRKGDEYRDYVNSHTFNSNPTISTTISVSEGGTDAICDLWQPVPDKENCEFCGSSKMHTCSEYKCRSLGKGCVFNEQDKTCSFGGTFDTTNPEIIGIDIEDYTYVKRINLYYLNAVEYEVRERVPAHEPLKITFTASEPSRCVLSTRPPYISKEEIDALGIPLPEIDLTGYEYKTMFTTEIRFPSEKFTQIDNFLLFLRCSDKSGNRNEKEYILNINTEEPEMDRSDPEILAVKTLLKNPIKPGENDILLFANEPFKACRFSETKIPYEKMKSLDCSTKERDIVYAAGSPLGSFGCSKRINVSAGAKNLYFVCEDHSNNVNDPFIEKIN